MNMRADAWLFGESAGRIVISCERIHIEPLVALTGRYGVPASLIGKVGGTHLTMAPWVDAPVEELNEAWRSGLRRALGAEGWGYLPRAQSPEQSQTHG